MTHLHDLSTNLVQAMGSSFGDRATESWGNPKAMSKALASAALVKQLRLWQI
jgi:hypothetical protein